MKDLPHDFYDFDEDSMSVIGATTGNSYTLGDAVIVKVLDVSLEKRQIDLLVTGWPDEE